MVDRDFQRKTNLLVQEQVGSYGVEPMEGLIEINAETVELIKKRKGGAGTKVINLIKSIEKLAEEASDDPYLIAMAERAQAVQESFEQRQTSTAEALEALLKEVETNEIRKKEQAEKSFDGLTYFVYRSLLDAKIENAEAVSRKIRQAFADFPNWKRSENALRELRKKVTFAIFAETDDLDRVTAMVDELFTLLEKADRI
jgi:type I restriction enzyme, R subunit